MTKLSATLLAGGKAREFIAAQNDELERWAGTTGWWSLELCWLRQQDRPVILAEPSSK
jgi:hypothetical protein